MTPLEEIQGAAGIKQRPERTLAERDGHRVVGEPLPAPLAGKFYWLDDGELDLGLNGPAASSIHIDDPFKILAPQHEEFTGLVAPETFTIRSVTFHHVEQPDQETS